MKKFDDGTHVIYINISAENDGTEIWKLIHDLRSTEPEDMYLPKLSERVRFFKEDEKGEVTLSNYFEEKQAKAVAKAVKKAVTKAVEEATNATEKKTKENMALSLIELGKLTLEDIAKCSGLTLRKIQMLAKTL